MRSHILRTVKTLGYILSLHASGLLSLSLFRAVEYGFLHRLVTQTDAGVAQAFLRGLWFDNVIMCYLSLLPLVVALVAATAGRHSKTLFRGIACWYGMLMLPVLAASAANTPYFGYFFKNINSSVFEWFGYAGTTAGMVVQESGYRLHIGLFVVVAVVFGWLAFKLCRWWHAAITATERKPLCVPGVLAGSVLTVLMGALCVFGIRGRMGYNPIKISQAYYCNDPFLNQLGINPAFNLLTSVLDDHRRENRELHLMPYAESTALARASLGITGPADSTHLLRRRVQAVGQPLKRNVVVILMESMSAGLMGAFGNQQHLTPNLDSLYRHSLAFSHFYSAGIHTNHGMTATLYSFPALMFRNLMKGTVTPHRDGLPTVLKGEGYRNLFFMTHEAQYDNMKAFFSTNGYEQIYSQENYPKEQVVNSFGVSDHFLFDYALNTISRTARGGKPFMATVLTVSNHPPYVIPSYFKPRTTEPETQIVEYADREVGEFLRRAAREPWYENTVFVVLADHGKMVGGSDGELPESYNHIPLMIFGPGIAPAVYDGLGMQVDVMPTLLGLLNMSYTYDGFGVDLLKQRRERVFYSADNQIVARDSAACYIYNPKMQRSFCYTVDGSGARHPVKPSARFKPLDRYVRAMIQTAEFCERKAAHARNVGSR